MAEREALQTVPETLAVSVVFNSTLTDCKQEQVEGEEDDET